jgi:hypothetical protein
MMAFRVRELMIAMPAAGDGPVRQQPLPNTQCKNPTCAGAPCPDPTIVKPPPAVESHPAKLELLRQHLRAALEAEAGAP